MLKLQPLRLRPASMADSKHQTWLVVGASRGIGLELVSQLLDQGHNVIATARDPHSSPTSGGQLYAMTGHQNGHKLTLVECDVSDEEKIKRFAGEIKMLGREGRILYSGIIDVVVINTGVMLFPSRMKDV
jgi:NAD(P)-dependent dehydrogenase (short-subunit alcohol dehydrogenase family)